MMAQTSASSPSSTHAAERTPGFSFVWHAAPIVFVVDDDASVRQSLESLINSVGWRTETFATAMEFLARPRPLSPSCLVLDVVLPDLSGLDLQARISVERIDMPIIFITGFGDVPMSVRAMKGGAIDFLPKPFRDEALLAAVGQALVRSRSILSEQAEIWALVERCASLSRRERQVMSLVVSGRSNKQVAGELDISEITVKAHRGNMMRKMHASSLPHLVKMAARLAAGAQFGTEVGSAHGGRNGLHVPTMRHGYIQPGSHSHQVG